MYDPVPFWTADRELVFDAPGYREQEAALMAVLERLSFRSVLDVGCGWGRIGALVKRRWPRISYTGVDLSAKRLTEAASRVDGKFVQADLLDMVLPQHDLVLAVEVLMHVRPEDIRTAVARLLAHAREWVASVDWVTPIDKETAPYNFLHDYTSLYGSNLVSVELVGLQALHIAVP